MVNLPVPLYPRMSFGQSRGRAAEETQREKDRDTDEAQERRRRLGQEAAAAAAAALLRLQLLPRHALHRPVSSPQLLDWFSSFLGPTDAMLTGAIADTRLGSVPDWKSPAVVPPHRRHDREQLQSLTEEFVVKPVCLARP